MNTDTGFDPFLSSMECEDSSKVTRSPAPPLLAPQDSPSAFTIPIEALLSPDQDHDLYDLEPIWPGEQRREAALRMNEEQSISTCSRNGGVEMDDVGSHIEVTAVLKGIDKTGTRSCMSEAEARRFVDEQFEKIAFVPSSSMTQLEKIKTILDRSECREFSAEDILNFDKKSLDSARACAKIVENIPQHYRWECVSPGDIPTCYTIVADCKKASSRDKPPRPMNAFMIWAQGARRLINELCPKMQNALISEALGFCWRHKSDAFKQVFEQEKIKLRRFHNAEFPEYKYKPKTKIQKAKEKQELTLTKAKFRAAGKREKLRPVGEIRQTRNKVGRPKKAAPGPDRKGVNPCEEMTARNPAIKDMLTLKILKDRSSRVSPVQEYVLSAFGQLSPVELCSPAPGDMPDDPGVSDTASWKGDGIKLSPPSVYDTPANTPPVGDDDEFHHSPSQPQSSAIPGPHIPHASTTLKDGLAPSSVLHNTPSPSHFPVGSAPVVTGPGSCHVLCDNELPGEKTTDLTDWLVQYIAGTLSSVASKTDSPANPYIGICSTDSNIDLNNNLQSVDNIRPPPPYAWSVRNCVPVSSTHDLDSVFLDLPGPLLSDDDMRTLLDSL